MNFSSLLTIIATLFLLLVCGYLCRRLGVIDDVASKRLSTLIIKLGQPMMIIHALITAEFSYENLKDGAIIVLLGIGLHACMSALAFVFCAGFKNMDERKITEFALIFTNCGFIGLPILEALFGPKGLFLASFYIISFHLFVWTWGLAILARGRDDIRPTVKKIFINFGSVPCMIGILIYMLAIPFPHFVLPSFLTKFTGYLNNLCTPITMLITGALLATRTPKQMLGSKKIYYFTFIKLFVMPLIICVIGKLIHLPDTLVLFITVEAALPAGSAITMYAEMYRLDAGYASQVVGTSSLLSIFSLPLVLMAAEWFIQRF